jgi:hypothetical protein
METLRSLFESPIGQIIDNLLTIFLVVLGWYHFLRGKKGVMVRVFQILGSALIGACVVHTLLILLLLML